MGVGHRPCHMGPPMVSHRRKHGIPARPWSIVRDSGRDARLTDLDERLCPRGVRGVLRVAIGSRLILELNHECVVIPLRLHAEDRE